MAKASLKVVSRRFDFFCRMLSTHQAMRCGGMLAGTFNRYLYFISLVNIKDYLGATM